MNGSTFSPLLMMRALTLLEVLIVLSLLTTVLMFISMAHYSYVRQVSINRTEVEEAQLARVILETIARDIRSVVVALREENLEVDTSALSMISGLDAASMLAGNLEQETTETEEEETIIYGKMPGIYGDLDWIQIDTAKLPRGEMYGSRQVRRGSTGATDRLSASKTVLYSLGRDTGQLTMDDPRYQPEQLIGAVGLSLDPNAARYGLFRRQLDRQATQYAIQEGYEWEYERDDEPFAPEVEWIEFAYFDPTLAQTGTTGDWTESWDMDDQQSLPLAVRITVAIRRPPLSDGLLSWGSANTAQEPVIYSLVVPIPVSVDVPVDEEATEEMPVE